MIKTVDFLPKVKFGIETKFDCFIILRSDCLHNLNTSTYYCDINYTFLK